MTGCCSWRRRRARVPGEDRFEARRIKSGFDVRVWSAHMVHTVNSSQQSSTLVNRKYGNHVGEQKRAQHIDQVRAPVVCGASLQILQDF